MDGLDRITEEIIQQANAEAEEITSAAKEQADAVVARAREDAGKTRDESTLSTDRQVEAIFAARESAKVLKRRQALLSAKQDIIAETLEKAKADALALPAAKYFALCEKMILSHAAEGSGEVFFNAGDKARLPKNFAAHLKKALPPDKHIAVSEGTVAIDGGFLLTYGDVAENCSISAIFQDKHDEFADLIRDTLF